MPDASTQLALDGAEMRRDAVLSPCGTYRYRLTRRWADGPTALFVMCNPSTADALVDDPTIRRCIGFAKREGLGAVEVVNLYAYRATKPLRVAQAHERGENIVGPENDDHIIAAMSETALVIFAWGGSVERLPGWERRVASVDVIALSREQSVASALGHTASGHPRHPLYVRGDAPLIDAELPV